MVNFSYQKNKNLELKIYQQTKYILITSINTHPSSYPKLLTDFMIRLCLVRIGNIPSVTPSLHSTPFYTKKLLHPLLIHSSFIRKFSSCRPEFQAVPSLNNDNPLKNTQSSQKNENNEKDTNSKEEQKVEDDATNTDTLGSGKVLPEGVSKDEFLTEIFGNLDPYIDTYSIYKQLREAEFTPEQSDQIISLLVHQLNSKLTKLSTIYAQNFELENEQYLFESAQQEIRVDITRSRDQHINELIALINILERDFNVINDELNNDYLKLKNDSQVAINEGKSENTLNSKKLFLRIQEANHKITTELNSDIKSEIESLRWYLSRWGLITLLVSLFLGLIIFYNTKRRNVTKEAKKDFAPLVIREPSEYEDDDYHTELDRGSV